MNHRKVARKHMEAAKAAMDTANELSVVPINEPFLARKNRQVEVEFWTDTANCHMRAAEIREAAMVRATALVLQSEPARAAD